MEFGDTFLDDELMDLAEKSCVSGRKLSNSKSWGGEGVPWSLSLDSGQNPHSKSVRRFQLPFAWLGNWTGRKDLGKPQRHSSGSVHAFYRPLCATGADMSETEFSTSATDVCEKGRDSKYGRDLIVYQDLNGGLRHRLSSSSEPLIHLDSSHSKKFWHQPPSSSSSSSSSSLSVISVTQTGESSRYNQAKSSKRPKSSKSRMSKRGKSPPKKYFQSVPKRLVDEVEASARLAAACFVASAGGQAGQSGQAHLPSRKSGPFSCRPSAEERPSDCTGQKCCDTERVDSNSSELKVVQELRKVCDRQNCLKDPQKLSNECDKNKIDDISFATTQLPSTGINKSVSFSNGIRSQDCRRPKAKKRPLSEVLLKRQSLSKYSSLVDKEREFLIASDPPSSKSDQKSTVQDGSKVKVSIITDSESSNGRSERQEHLERGTRSSMSMPFASTREGMPPDCADDNSPTTSADDVEKCHIRQRINSRSNLMEQSTLTSSMGEDEDESIILVTEEEEGRDPLWTLVNTIRKPSVGNGSTGSKSGSSSSGQPESGPVSIITGIRMTHGQSPINRPSVSISRGNEFGNPPPSTIGRFLTRGASSTDENSLASDRRRQQMNSFRQTSVDESRSTPVEKLDLKEFEMGVEDIEEDGTMETSSREQTPSSLNELSSLSLSPRSQPKQAPIETPPKNSVHSGQKKSKSSPVKRRGFPLSRAMTLPTQSIAPGYTDNECRPLLTTSINEEAILTPMRTTAPTIGSQNDNRETILDIPLLIAIADGNGNGINFGTGTENNGNSYRTGNENSFGNENGNGSSPLTIPIFTVTINPLEADEMTYVPDSPTDFPVSKKSGCGLSSRKSQAEIANMTIIMDDAETAKMLNDGYDSDEASRRCSIGSASSLQSDNHHLGLGDLGIRRVSEISHINELRREMSGMEHLASEYYEISREPNPDAISLDSIHKQVLKRCQNKYIPLQRSSIGNKCFVIIATGFTLMGIIYGFWYKNFGPGKKMNEKYLFN